MTTTPKRKPRGHPFAPGNQAAAKPAAEHTIARTYRLPPRTLAQIHAMVGNVVEAEQCPVRGLRIRIQCQARDRRAELAQP